MTVHATTQTWRALAAGTLAALALGAAHAQTPVEATTPSGDRILLYPDGRWEYADPAKRAATPKPQAPATPQSAGAAPAAAGATPVAASTTSTGTGACPPDAQGHLFWLGRCVPPGDKDYNRGSLSGKGR